MRSCEVMSPDELLQKFSVVCLALEDLDDPCDLIDLIDSNREDEADDEFAEVRGELLVRMGNPDDDANPLLEKFRDLTLKISKTQRKSGKLARQLGSLREQIIREIRASHTTRLPASV